MPIYEQVRVFVTSFASTLYLLENLTERHGNLAIVGRRLARGGRCISSQACHQHT
jgi:hypothetical protein